MAEHAKGRKYRVVRRAKGGLAADKLIREAAARIDLITLNMDVNGTDSETYWALRDVRNKLHAVLALPAALPDRSDVALARKIDEIIGSFITDDTALRRIHSATWEVLNA